MKWAWLFLFLAACTVVPPAEPPVQPPVQPEPQPDNMLENPSFCNVDADCTCGGIDTNTNDCFIGNKLYGSKYVDFSQNCPDFCSGIDGRLETRCVDNSCQGVRREIVPESPDEKMFDEEPSLASSRHWLCEDGSWAENPVQCFENKCLTQSDCQLIGVKGICGPYKIAAPKTMHKPPVFYEFRCGQQPCSVISAMCVAPELMPLITNVVCENNKCITLPKQEECQTSSDCVKNSCCHATGCVPKYAQPYCEGIMCTQECAAASLDCGGSCECIEGSCTGIQA